MLQLTKQTRLTHEQVEYIDTAISSSKVLLNVINDILNIAQIEAGKLVLHNQLFSPHEVLETIYKFFKHSTESKDIEFSVEMEPGFPQLLIGDEIRIRQILFNLVGNSVKFTDKGYVAVSAKLLPYQRKKGMAEILFTVTDTGIGIPPEKVVYVFESFTQVDGTYTRRYQGTGLGLGIVKSLVDYMNGTIAVESEVEVGTTMYVTLQLGLPSQKQIDHRPMHEEGRQQITDLSVLVVEDDRVNQIAITRMLQKMGHKVTTVGDGQKALDILLAEDFDFVFMDIQMPILDGIETTKIIRTSSDMISVSNIPIVALTAHAMPEDRENFLDVGMNDYISKPVSIEQLAIAIERINK